MENQRKNSGTFIIWVGLGTGALLLVVLLGILFLAFKFAPVLRATFVPTAAFTQTPAVTSMPLPVEITDAKGVIMRLVPTGIFTMGSDDHYAKNASPAHSVAVDSFYMDVYEVTRARYKACVIAGVCSEPRDVPSMDLFYGYSSYPMTKIDWYQSRAYCEWRGARLPSEAEWEKAARGPDGRMYPWGEEFDPSYVSPNYDKANGIVDVGTYEKGKSPYGLYDMAGNVWEWTATLYLPYPGNQAAPEDYREGEYVLRGGASHFGDPYALTTWFRYASFAEDQENYIGFRCARAAQP